jgi:hypothetical protein
MNRRPPGKNQLPEGAVKVGKAVGGGMGLIFAGIGVTVLIFLWGSSFDEFGSPPLFFRVFGSFIALAFVLMGGGTFLGSLFAGNALKNISPGTENQPDSDTGDDAPATDAPVSYTCPRCGAPLGKGAEVSPHGDVKCGYCNAWFNIH